MKSKASWSTSDQVSPASSVLNKPLAVAAYSVDGWEGAMARSSIKALSPLPEYTFAHVWPPSVLLETPKPPAYRISGVVGSTTRTPAPLGGWLAVALQCDPRSSDVYTPPTDAYRTRGSAAE